MKTREEVIDIPTTPSKGPGMGEPVIKVAPSDASDIFKVPNQISCARLILSVILFALIPFKYYWAGLILFSIAAGTDWIDGWYARKYQQVSQLGRILDPFCDKILICGVFILLAVEMDGRFAWYQKIAGWMAVIVVGRELLVTLLRSLIEGSGGDFSAKMAGKVKMVFQCAAAIVCLIALATQPPDAPLATEHAENPVPFWLNSALILTIWLAVISTLHSGYLYVRSAREAFLGKPIT
jgi:CDP-diacylglycerol---glycerol-3-phosphate 3-phosphatidyltransferase